MRRLTFAAVAVLLPALALADEPSAVLDFTSGPVHDLVVRTLGLARSFFVFSLVLGLVVEAFGRSPTSPRDYAGCLFRAVVVLVLLVFYTPVMGSVVNLTEGVAARVTPEHAWTDFSHETHEYYRKLFDKKSPADEAAEAVAGEGSSGGSGAASLAGSIVGGYFYDSIMAAVILLAEGIYVALGLLARVLCAAFFVLGPLALVFSIPRSSDVGARWFRIFVTIASWPVFSGMLLAITSALGAHGIYTSLGGSLSAAVAAVLMICMAVASPLLATAFVGGSLKNVAGHGFDAAHARVTSAARSLSRRGAGDSRNSGGDVPAPDPSASSPRGRGGLRPVANPPRP